MKIDGVYEVGAGIEMAKAVDNGKVTLWVDERVAFIRKPNAIKIIEHLQKVFELNRIVGIRDGEKWCNEHGFKTENCDPDCDE